MGASGEGDKYSRVREVKSKVLRRVTIEAKLHLESGQSRSSQPPLSHAHHTRLLDKVEKFEKQKKILLSLEGGGRLKGPSYHPIFNLTCFVPFELSHYKMGRLDNFFCIYNL